MFWGLIRQDKGSAAVEFALVGLPFVLITIGLIEVSMMFTANSLLQDATSDAARKIRVGQVQQAPGNPEDVFRDQLCDTASVFLNCDNIQYEVFTLPGGFNDADDNPPVFDANGDLISQGFSAGGSDDVVLVRTIYRYPLITPLIGPLLADGPNQTKFMMTTMVLQTEPYEFNGGP
jgi:Flp pilus assembly protein TadG